MPTLLISTIGQPTSDYDQTVYQLDDGTTHSGCYHQDLLLRHLFPEGLAPGDAFWLVSTQEALDRHADTLSLAPRTIAIPKGGSNDEFWSMYSAIATPLAEIAASRQPEDAPITIHLDLTHGFRVQPVFLQAAVRACCDLYQNLHLAEIWYAFYERGHPGPHPLRTVTPIVDMERVATDVRAFLAHGVGEALAERLVAVDERIRQELAVARRQAAAQALHMQTDGDTRPMGAIIEDLLGPQVDSRHLREGAHAIRSFAALARLNHTPAAACITRDLLRLTSHARALFTGSLAPIGQALAALGDQLAPLLPKDPTPLWGWHRALAAWCLDRSLFQQALTHGAEMTTTRMCEEQGQDPLDRVCRQRMGHAVSAFGQRQLKHIAVPAEWKPMVDAANALQDVRNTVNHAGLNASGTTTPTTALADQTRSAIQRIIAAHDAAPALPDPRELERAVQAILVLPRNATVLDPHTNTPRMVVDDLLDHAITPCHPEALLCTQTVHEYRPRCLIEHNPQYLQVVPYAVFTNAAGQVWAYRRCGGDGRLDGRGSIGVGGHIEVDDDRDHLLATAYAALQREVAEELINPPQHIPDLPLAWVQESDSPVGRVHLGLIWAIPWTKAEPPQPRKGEKLTSLGFLDPGEITAEAGFETWSVLAMQAVTAGAILCPSLSLPSA